MFTDEINIYMKLVLEEKKVDVIMKKWYNVDKNGCIEFNTYLPKMIEKNMKH